MSKHTPGPWWANEKRHDDYPTKISIETDSYNICLVDGGLDQQANANLIAAAPDLLEALENLFIDYKQLADSGDAGFWKLEDQDVAKKAMAAIARAKGESS